MIIFYKPKPNLWQLIGLCLLLAVGCSKSDDQQKFENQALASPDKITETDTDGNIEGNTDPDDWRVSPMYRSLIKMNSKLTEPPYPNPLLYNQIMNIEIKFNVSNPVDAIIIRKFRAGGDRQYPQISSRKGNQLTSFNSIPIRGKKIAESAGSGGNGLYRILIYDRRQNLISYGDVQIE